MSKAFVKEDQDMEEDFDTPGDADQDEQDPSDEPKFRSGKNYITDRGFDRLRGELHELLYNERPKLVEVVAWAASNGDRSENADYTYGKKRLREIDKRIRFLQRRMDIAEIVVPENQKGDRVLFGATVTVLDENDAQRMYKVVGIDETDAKVGKVSWISPIGKALLQAKVGEAVLLHTPKGQEELEILKVEFKKIEE
jgi:transcription elongation factor GreB